LQAAKGFSLLDWDSTLFGFPVARLHVEAITPQRMPRALDDLRAAGVRLVYMTVPPAMNESASLLLAAGARSMGTRRVYHKAVPSEPHAVVAESWLGQPSTPELESLALDSGTDSRFKRDPLVPVGIFETLYRTWMRRSLSGEIAADVLVWREDQRLAGMVTVAAPNAEGTVTIGLVAVGEEYRRRGVGRALMRAVDAWAATRGATTVAVVTQGGNHAACGLYSGCGYALETEESAFHLWLQAPP